MGDVGGEKTVTLTAAQMPRHRHQLVQFGIAPSAGGYPGANGFVVGGAGQDAQAGGRLSDYQGNDQAHNNMPPYMIVNYEVICG